MIIPVRIMTVTNIRYLCIKHHSQYFRHKKKKSFNFYNLPVREALSAITQLYKIHNKNHRSYGGKQVGIQHSKTLVMTNKKKKKKPNKNESTVT